MTAKATSVDTGRRCVSRRITVNAPAAEIFALVIDPHRHPELDGSGTLRDIPVRGPDRLTEGAKFSVGMKQYGAPYKITSRVTAVETDRLVEWKHPLGHRWRWQLEAIAPGATEVTETFDYSHAKGAALLELTGFPAKNGKGIEATLEGLAARFA